MYYVIPAKGRLELQAFNFLGGEKKKTERGCKLSSSVYGLTLLLPNTILFPAFYIVVFVRGLKEMGWKLHNLLGVMVIQMKKEWKSDKQIKENKQTMGRLNGKKNCGGGTLN